jgi:hypothetical protein
MLETKPTTTPIKILAALSVRVLRHSLAKTAWTFVWDLAVFNLINAFGNLVKPTAIWLTLSISVIYWVFFMGTKIISGIYFRLRAFMAMVFFAFFMIVFNLSYSGEKALQFFGIGGGIPVSILKKTMTPGGKDVVAQIINACMILNAGSHIIILKDPTLTTCQLEFSQSRVHHGEMLKGVEIISGSDVISIGAPMS